MVAVAVALIILRQKFSEHEILIELFALKLIAFVKFKPKLS